MTLQSALAPTLLPTWTAIATAVLGGFVAYHAYRGYRRNASTVMLYLAIAIVLLTTAPVALRLGLELLMVADVASRALLAQVLRIIGLMTVLYALAG